MGINIKIRKDNLYKEHVYIIGVYISGNKLENDLSPYSLEFILKNNVNVYKFKKKTLFNKVVDADVLKYSYKGRCCLKNINTYYENIKLNLKKHTIEDFAIEIKCRDRKEKSIFQIQTKCIVNEESWVQKRKENGDFFICSDKQLLCRVVPTYTIVKKRLDGIFQRKIPSIKVYISSSYDIMYDILNKLPAPGADAFANDNCIFIISEFGKIKKSKICHELCHIFINNQIKGKSLIDIKLVEGVCECISEQFILEEGTISLRKKCAIAFDVLNINTCNILLKELDNIKKNSDTYSLVTYNIVPYIVKMIINQIGLDGLLNRIRKNKTLKEVITNTFNGFEKFWTILQESLMEEINVREYNELYAQIIMKQYENIMEDISQDAYSKLKIKFKNIYELLNKEEYILVKKELTEF